MITTEATTYETTVPTTSTEPITTTKTIVPTSYRKVTSIIAKKATTIKPREESKLTKATTLKLKEETTSRPKDVITKGTTAKAVKVTIITSENNNDASNSAISLILISSEMILHTVKSRAVDRSTIQYWTFLAKGHST